MKATIDCLPNEILIKIISKLCLYDRISCEQVCCRWQGLANIYLADVKAFNFGHHLEICDDTDHRVYDPNGLTQHYERHIKVFDETVLIKHILSFTSRLKCLNVYLRKGQSVDIIKQYCTDIECLTLISFDDQVMLNAIPMISELGTTLRHLKICDETRVIRKHGLQDLMAGMLSHCTQLQVFHLFRIELNAKSCQMIGKDIKEINLQLGSGSLEGLIRSRIFENLESLIIRNSFINKSRMKTICQTFINLKKLFIDMYSDCDDFTYVALIAKMTRLEHLEINFAQKLYNESLPLDNILTQIFVNCVNLTKISLSGCLNVNISDTCLTIIVLFCQRLESLNFWKFGDMRKVTLKGVRALASMARLRNITLDALFFNKELFDPQLLDQYFQNLFEINPNLDFICLFSKARHHRTKNLNCY